MERLWDGLVPVISYFLMAVSYGGWEGQLKLAF